MDRKTITSSMLFASVITIIYLVYKMYYTKTEIHEIKNDLIVLFVTSLSTHIVMQNISGNLIDNIPKSLNQDVFTGSPNF
tara:strand:+ start:531 stop:770 length:240 start_codon:yes stop_codon:yes gene_type:complete